MYYKGASIFNFNIGTHNSAFYFKEENLQITCIYPVPEFVVCLLLDSGVNILIEWINTVGLNSKTDGCTILWSINIVLKCKQAKVQTNM